MSSLAPMLAAWLEKAGRSRSVVLEAENDRPEANMGVARKDLRSLVRMSILTAMDSEALTDGTLTDGTPMVRVNAYLPGPMKTAGESLAKAEGISFAELIRQALAFWMGPRNRTPDPIATEPPLRTPEDPNVDQLGNIVMRESVASAAHPPATAEPYCPDCPHLLDDHGPDGCLDGDCHCERPQPLASSEPRCDGCKSWELHRTHDQERYCGNEDSPFFDEIMNPDDRCVHWRAAP